MISAFQTIVIDTNVLVSGLFFPGSYAARALDKARMEADLLISDSTADELRSVMRRQKFERYLPLPLRILSIEEHIDACVFAAVTETVLACRDPRDDKFLELALAGRADLILTGDADLQALHPWRSISILSPSAGLALYSWRTGFIG